MIRNQIEKTWVVKKFKDGEKTRIKERFDINDKNSFDRCKI